MQFIYSNQCIQFQILTPAFHFKILEDFIDVFQEQSAILVSKMSKEVGSKSFNLFPYVTLCTLDIICGEFKTFQRLSENCIN